MATSVARRVGGGGLGVVEAKALVLEKIAQGFKVEDACKEAGRTRSTYLMWMKEDPAFNASSKALKTVVKEHAETGRLPVPDFPEFCEVWLKQPLFDHQLRIWDAIEGRDPRDMHTAMRFDRGMEWDSECEGVPGNRIIVNVPPGHAKTTSISINYCTWLIHKNPNIKIVIISKNMQMAQKIVSAIKFRLTSPVFRDMHMRFAPEGGWKDPDQSWTQTAIYVQGKDDGEKDPTLQALGIGSQIYGARSDVIILDDAVTLSNVGEYEKWHNWLDQEVESRLDGSGLLALLGTRVAPMDLYKEMREVENDDEELVYTYFSMPALLDEGDGTTGSWVTLWPFKFPEKKLRKMRRGPEKWALVYQQMDVSEDAAFKARAVEAAVNAERFPGPMTTTGMGHRIGGMAGLYIVGGLDPATVGFTSMIVSGLDKAAPVPKRYVLDGVNVAGMLPNVMRDHIKRLTVLYHIQEWVIERNAFQRFLTQDPDLLAFLRSLGCKLTEHNTTADKLDADFGVPAMSPLFDSCGTPAPGGRDGIWKRTPDIALIELPSRRQNAWVGQLVQQLVTWEPKGMKRSQKTDIVMALWFTEIAFKRVLRHGMKRQTHMQNAWMSPARRGAQNVINLSDLRAAQAMEA